MQFNVSFGKVSTKGQKRENAIQRVKVNYETQFIQLTIDNSAHKGRICRREEKEVGVVREISVEASLYENVSPGQTQLWRKNLRQIEREIYFSSLIHTCTYVCIVFYRVSLVRLVELHGQY